MPITQQELEKKKDELITKLLKFDDYLRSKMDYGKLYSDKEFSALVKDFAIEEYGTDSKLGLDKDTFGKGLTAEGAKIYQILGEFTAHLQFIGSLGQRTTTEGKFYFRQTPSQERVSSALKFIRTKL